jgi:multisubunit Na+/H+ antiporter MnhC subunit
MGGFQVVLAVFVLSAFVIGVAVFATYLLNKSVSKSGQ